VIASAQSGSPDFKQITELAGDAASREQIERAYRRYYWVGGYSGNANVLEVACGAGQGLAYLATLAQSVKAGDVSEPTLAIARAHYGNRFELRCFPAEELPYSAASFDVVAILEALYYLKDVERFFAEAHRVLRPGGHLLIVTANKDLFDFTPSPFSVAYYGVQELSAMLAKAGFTPSFFGDSPLSQASFWQRALRPIKRLVTTAGLMPTGKRTKAIVKRIVFGKMMPLPAEITPGMKTGAPPVPLVAGQPDVAHKVIFCAARRS
jgi:SAM-dependent methyltransferase